MIIEYLQDGPPESAPAGQGIPPMDNRRVFAALPGEPERNDRRPCRTCGRGDVNVNVNVNTGNNAAAGGGSGDAVAESQRLRSAAERLRSTFETVHPPRANGAGMPYGSPAPTGTERESSTRPCFEGRATVLPTPSAPAPQVVTRTVIVPQERMVIVPQERAVVIPQDRIVKQIEYRPFAVVWDRLKKTFVNRDVMHPVDRVRKVPVQSGGRPSFEGGAS